MARSIERKETKVLKEDPYFKMGSIKIKKTLKFGSQKRMKDPLANGYVQFKSDKLMGKTSRSHLGVY
jgi:hypothetical protein